MHWYNTAHHHSALGLMTPESIHHGRALELRQHRQQVLSAAFAAHPQRFVRGTPTPPSLPTQVWINQPKELTH
jgi:putative transposase